MTKSYHVNETVAHIFHSKTHSSTSLLSVYNKKRNNNQNTKQIKKKNHNLKKKAITMAQAAKQKQIKKKSYKKPRNLYCFVSILRFI